MSDKEEKRKGRGLTVAVETDVHHGSVGVPIDTGKGNRSAEHSE